MKTTRSISVLLLIGLAFYPAVVNGQNLDSFLEDQLEESTDYTSATFKSTRILNGHSVELAHEGQMDVRISHRFGTINSGAYEFFGLDQAHIHLSFEYGINDWLMVGLGRGTFEKTVDGFAKIKLLRQSKGIRNMPVTVTMMSGMYVNGLHWSEPERENYFYHRLSYAYQLMVARKFNERFSLQVTPSYYHENLVETPADPNDLFSLGVGSRIKLSNRISVNAEYYYIFNRDNQNFTSKIFNPLSLGIDIETGGHVFQIIMTNAVAMTENGFLGHTRGEWLEGDIHLGFNISRVFQLKK